ncbi:MAG: carbamate kinase [Bacillota bacterium]|jgi:carbamate kinase|nr:carbamate kinase [Candidatus Fermentithermobacillaceae bacterium]
MDIIVVALGGNAILQKGERGTAEDQRRNIQRTAAQLAGLVQEGYRLVITHGNGPQVGNILIQNEAGRGKVPQMPMDICGAQSQGMIGYMLQMCLRNALRKLDLDIPISTVVTQTLVDKHDPAFSNPTKPVGPFYSKEWAQERMASHGETWIEDAGRGWRRVVPSPEPKAIIETPSIRRLVDEGHIVICSGGGGIPVVELEDGSLVGVEAVVEKDLSAEILASSIGATSLIILTDVNGAALNYRDIGERWLGQVTLSRLADYYHESHFFEGSMRPKVKAIMRFIEHGGKLAVIASLDKARDAALGQTGTRIIG